ncbi:MAG: hypothetical protein J7L04_04730 [Bacteroidales bacterium]|nr:hypothetical protein [Bacteroidales bacterium]
MTKLFLILTFFLFPLMSCHFSQDKGNTNIQKNPVKETSINSETGPMLTLIWETPSDLKIPESVIYTEEAIYVSNINGSPTEENGEGFISILNKEGKIMQLKWITGLNAPKGMGISGDRMYVADIHNLVEIDINNSKIIGIYQAEGSKFLNDIAIDPQGRVYISDMKKDVIYRFADGKLEKWLESDLLVSPNGLFSDHQNLMIGTKNRILKVNTESKSIESYIENTGGVDGLEAVGGGKYIFSDWLGHIHIADPETKKVLLLDSTADKINAADINYITSKQLLLVPTFLDNRIMAYHLGL